MRADEKQMTEMDALRSYDEYLDDCFEPISIMGLEYSISKTWKVVDEIAYREGFNNWIDAEGIEIG